MNSDSSDSPLVLTPESTGTTILSQLNSLPNSPAGSTVTANATRKARRQTAFYPNMNSSNKPQNPFSRSAAKRESVMALGSIEHLQYFFTKTGLAAKKKLSDKAHLGLVPAIGGRGHVPSTPSITTLSDFVLPSPAIPSPPTLVFPPHVKNYDVDPESLLPGVIQDLISVAEAWKLEKDGGRDEADDDDDDDERQPSSDLGGAAFDVLEVLKITTRAIRSTRNYLLSLWDESEDTLRAHVQFRSRILGSVSREPSSSNNASTTTTTTALPSTTTTATTTSTTTSLDPISRIRRSALEVLTVLRQVEENYRLPLEDEAYDAQSDGAHSRGAAAGTSSSSSYTPLDLPPAAAADDDHPSRAGDFFGDPDLSISFSLVRVQGQYKTVPVWEDHNDDDDSDSSPERDDERRRKKKKERGDPWEDRLVLGTGWLYRQDVRLSELERERAVVASYLDTVDEVLFDGRPPANALAPTTTTTTTTSERGWHRVRKQREGRGRTPNRRVSVAVAGAGALGGLGVPAGRGEKRRVSTGMMLDGVERTPLSDEPEEMEDAEEDVEGDAVVSDDDLPEWARRTAFVGDELGRAHAMLAAFLPSNLLPSLRPPESRADFLHGLSSGQLLCVAYNACIRKSKQPWGYVSKNGIHDVLALEKEEEEAAAAKKKKANNNNNNNNNNNGEVVVDVNKRVWTFRRTDNLRLWIGALKLRYMLPVQMPFQPLSNSGKRPGTPSSSSASTPPPSSPALVQTFSDHLNTTTTTTMAREPPILFDAKVVAKREEGWEDMLENVLLRWVGKAVEERRSHL